MTQTKLRIWLLITHNINLLESSYHEDHKESPPGHDEDLVLCEYGVRCEEEFIDKIRGRQYDSKYWIMHGSLDLQNKKVI